jgi:hypothetical protein
LFMLTKMAGDTRHTPASVAEADHFEAVAGAGCEPSVPSSLAEFGPLVVA